LPSSLSINSASGLISGTISPGSAIDSPFTATVTASDGSNTASQTFTWNVLTLVTLSPVANQTNAEGDLVNLQVTAKDPKNLPLNFSATNLPAGLGIDANTGLISGTISPGAAASSPFSTMITASDGTDTGSRALTWTVTPIVTVTPVLDQSKTEGDTVSLQVSATDAKNMPLTFSATGLPSGLSIDAGTGLIHGTLAAGSADSSPITTTVTATDATFSGKATFTWTISHVVTINAFVNPTNVEGDMVNLPITASDTKMLPLTFSATGLPGGLSIDAKTGVISGTINAHTAASSPFMGTITATDGTFSGHRSIIWAVTPVVNFVNVLNQTNKEGDAPHLQISASDTKSLTLSFSATNLPTGLNINSSTGLISGTISTGAAALSPYATVVMASDGTFSNDLAFTWTVGT
jgi:hypothetical protein